MISKIILVVMAFLFSGCESKDNYTETNRYEGDIVLVGSFAEEGGYCYEVITKYRQDKVEYMREDGTLFYRQDLVKLDYEPEYIKVDCSKSY